MQKETNYGKFQELNTDELREADGGFDWVDVVDFIIRCTIVVV